MALEESFSVESINFLSTLERSMTLRVGDSACVLRSEANEFRCLVMRPVIFGPVVGLFTEFLEHFDEFLNGTLLLGRKSFDMLGGLLREVPVVGSWHLFLAGSNSYLALRKLRWPSFR